MRPRFSLLRPLVATVALAAAFATPALADPVRYDFSSGFVTLTASVDGVDIAGPVTASLSGTQVTIDEDTPELLSIQLDATGPIAIAFASPYAGYDEVVIDSLSLSGGSGLLVPLDPGPPAAEYFFLVDPLSIELVVSGDGFAAVPIGGDAAASGSLFVDSSLNQLSLSGITLGSFGPFGDELSPIVLKADFVFSGSPIPEPSAALLFLAGALTLAGRMRAVRS